MADPKKILLVEDEASLAMILGGQLKNAGFTVISVADGEEGLTHAKAEHPDLILLDLRIPKLDGLAMLKLLREDVWGASARVVALTNFSDAANTKAANVLGVNEIWTKATSDVSWIVGKVKEMLG